MSPETPGRFGDYIVYVDESRDHGLAGVDPNYPVFVLAFCIFKKQEYIDRVCRAVQKLKLKYWGHDEVVLHEHEIRKPNKEYSFLFDMKKRQEFLEDIDALVAGEPFLVIASVIRKLELSRQYTLPGNPYELAMAFGLERTYRHLNDIGQGQKPTHVIVEKRGPREDAQLELAFRRICDGANALDRKFPMELVMVPKSANSCGLQLADLLARPIGIKVLRPTQANLAYNTVEKKLRRSAAGEVKGWGLKVFP